MPDPKRVKYRKILINKPFVLPMFPSFRSAVLRQNSTSYNIFAGSYAGDKTRTATS